MTKRSKAKAPRRRIAPIDPELLRFSPLLDDEPKAPSRYTVKVKVWRWKGQGGWHFANLPKKESAEIKQRHAAAKRGWGSIRVNIQVGDTEWETSLFPNSKQKCFLFAVKASVRKAEEIEAGDMITAHISVR